MHVIGLRHVGFALGSTLLTVGAAFAQPDNACAVADRDVVQRLKPLIERTDLRSSAIAGSVFQDLTWARLDCRDGRHERAMATYKRLTEALDRYPTARTRAAEASEPEPDNR